MRVTPRSFPSWLDPLALVELFVLANIAFLAVDIYVAHSTNRFAEWPEWIPLAFSCTGPLLLLLAMGLGCGVHPPPREETHRSNRAQASRDIGLFVGGLSVCVGVAGLIWHLEGGFFQEQTLKNLVYAAPFVAPLSYAGVGMLLLLDRMVPAESDEWSRWVLLLAWGGFVGNFVLSLTDHAQNAFYDWREVIAVVASALAVGTLLSAVIYHHNRSFLRICVWVMLLQIVVGVLGWFFHLRAILSSPMETLWDRVVYAAPIFAPLLFANLALLALIGLWSLLRRPEVEAVGTHFPDLH